MNTKVLIGIDPGKNGAIVVCNNNECGFIVESKIVMPIIGKEYDLNSMCDIIRCHHDNRLCMVFLENPPSIPFISKSSDRELAYNIGLLEGILSAFKIPYMKIRPKDWQKKAWDGVELVKKSDGKTDTKKTSLLSIRQKLPNEDFVMRKSAQHDGVIDAILMCWAMKDRI